jgi:hypothetical protein
MSRAQRRREYIKIGALLALTFVAVCVLIFLAVNHSLFTLYA